MDDVSNKRKLCWIFTKFVKLLLIIVLLFFEQKVQHRRQILLPRPKHEFHWISLKIISFVQSSNFVYFSVQFFSKVNFVRCSFSPQENVHRWGATEDFRASSSGRCEILFYEIFLPFNSVNSYTVHACIYHKIHITKGSK